MSSTSEKKNTMRIYSNPINGRKSEENSLKHIKQFAVRVCKICVKSRQKRYRKKKIYDENKNHFFYAAIVPPPRRIVL